MFCSVPATPKASFADHVHGQKDGQVECNDSELVQMADKEKKKRKCWERSKQKAFLFNFRREAF
jgi:hypothetical protein